MSCFIVLVPCSCRAINCTRAVLFPCLIVLMSYRASCLKTLSKRGPPTYRTVLKPVNYRVVMCCATKNRAGPLGPARFDISSITTLLV